MPSDSRAKLLTGRIRQSSVGVEIGPLHKPLTPKRDGYSSLSMDIATRGRLIELYPNLSEIERNSIEDVDIIYQTSFYDSIVEYVKKGSSALSRPDSCLDYIISSHNFEHLPNPVQFLNDCEKCLKPGGLLVMAIPIASRCFDATKALSSSGDLLNGFIEDRKKPCFGSVFDHIINFPIHNGAPVNMSSFDINKITLHDVSINPEWYGSILSQWHAEYINCHCWYFNHYSFELIFRELRSCGFFPYLILDSISQQGYEFFVYIARSNNADNAASRLISSSERSSLLSKSLVMHVGDLQRNNRLS